MRGSETAKTAGCGAGNARNRRVFRVDRELLNRRGMRMLAIGLAGLLLLVVACGSETPAPEGDPLFELAASDGAQKELGVVTWRGTSAHAGATTIRGVDASGAT